MNGTIKYLTIAMFCLINLTAYAQDSNTNLVEMEEEYTSLKIENSTVKGSAVMGAFGELIYLTPEEKVEKPVENSFYRSPQRLPKEFTGYTIQVMTSMEQLDKNHFLMTNYGGIILEEAANPRYCYLMGQFRTKRGAKKYLKSVIKPYFSTAKVIKYKKGNRTKLK